MNRSAEKNRVVIANVQPSVDNGLFPAKATLGKNLLLSADIFADGHDQLRATVMIKHQLEKQWTVVEMTPQYNDVFTATFRPLQTGIYQFRVSGWIDHFATWQTDLIRKFKAGQKIDVEIERGMQLAKEANNLLKKPVPSVQEWINTLTDAADEDTRVSVATDRAIADVLSRAVKSSFISTTPRAFEIRVEPKLAAYSTWYELFPRSCSTIPGTHGTFKDVKALLPRISQMGFDVLYLPPIHPIGTVKRKGRNNSLIASEEDPGSPWAIGNVTGGHKAIHSELGTLKDFRDLVASARKMGIEIAMDIAFQCAPDHPYVKQHPEWFKWRPDGTVQYAENPPKKYEDIIPFDFECDACESLWEELKSIFIYWIEKGVQIFRVDNPHTKAFPFWKWVIPEIKQSYPDVIFLAEAFARPRLMEHLAKIGFSQSYTYFAWRNTKKELEEYVTELTTTDVSKYLRPNFWPNTPDILTRELVEGKENAHIIRVLLAATLSASYGIYGPVFEYTVCEPAHGKEEYTDNEKYEIKHWDWTRHTKTTELITRINRIRNAHPALQDTYNIQFLDTNNERIICYKKEDHETGDTIIIVVNLDPFTAQEGHVNVPYIPGFPENKFSVYDLLSGDKYDWQSGWNYVSLNPYDLPAHILLIEQRYHTQND